MTTKVTCGLYFLKDDENVLGKVKEIVSEELEKTLDSGERYLTYLLDNDCKKERVLKAEKP